MMKYMISNMLWVFLTAFCVAFLQTNIGFGFPIVAMIVFPLLFPFSTAVTLSLIIASGSTLYLSIAYRNHIEWKIIGPLLIVSIACSFIFTQLTIDMSQPVLTIMLGIMLVVISIFTVKFSRSIKIKRSVRTAAITGLISGIGNGLFGIAGPPVAIYLMASLEEKRSYLASIQSYFFISSVITIVVRVLNNAISPAHVPLIGIGWAGMAIGTLSGRKLFERLPKELLKKIVYGFVGVSGIWMIIQTSLL